MRFVRDEEFDKLEREVAFLARMSAKELSEAKPDIERLRGLVESMKNAGPKVKKSEPKP